MGQVGITCPRFHLPPLHYPSTEHELACISIPALVWHALVWRCLHQQGLMQVYSSSMDIHAVAGTSLEGPSMADSVQLWGSKAANRRYSEPGEGMLDRQGGPLTSTAVAGIENRVAPEDLPLSRLPSRAARCLAGRRPLEPVAEVPQGQVRCQLPCLAPGAGGDFCVP